MKFVVGEPPKWKGKPKASPLDTDPAFLALRTLILSGNMKPFQEAGIRVHELEDGRRLKTKHPARLVRDRLRRVLQEAHIEPDYVITCRQTDNPGEWGIWVLHEPRDSASH